MGIRTMFCGHHFRGPPLEEAQHFRGLTTVGCHLLCQRAQFAAKSAIVQGPEGSQSAPGGGPKLGMAPGPKGATIRYSRVAGWGAGISVGGLGPPHFEVIVKD